VCVCVCEDESGSLTLNGCSEYLCYAQRERERERVGWWCRFKFQFQPGMEQKPKGYRVTSKRGYDFPPQMV